MRRSRQVRSQRLVEELIAELDPAESEVTSPRSGPARSTLVFVSHREPGRNGEIHTKLKEADVGVAHRRGQLRVSPHLYNTSADIARALRALNP